MAFLIYKFNVLFFLLMTSSMGGESANAPFPVYRIKEVKFAGGVPGASSQYSDSWVPEKAFEIQSAGTSGWQTHGSARSLPVMIWYDFKSEGIRPSEVSFQPAGGGSYLQGTPTSYQFVGSNDAICNDDATWTILCEDLSDRQWRNDWEVRYCKVKPEVSEKNRCLGIRVLANRRGDGYTSLRNIRMWAIVEDKMSGKEEL